MKFSQHYISFGKSIVEYTLFHYMLWYISLLLAHPFENRFLSSFYAMLYLFACLRCLHEQQKQLEWNSQYDKTNHLTWLKATFIAIVRIFKMIFKLNRIISSSWHGLHSIDNKNWKKCVDASLCVCLVH